MKTIEEIARDYQRSDEDDGTTATAFQNGAEWMRKELTRWHNPFLKDMPKGNVLVKYIAVGCPNEPYYTVGRREPSGWWDCENELVISPRFEIVGWQEIHE